MFAGMLGEAKGFLHGEEEFAEDGTVTLGLAAPVASFDALADALRCATNGRLELRADDAPESSR